MAQPDYSFVVAGGMVIGRRRTHHGRSLGKSRQRQRAVETRSWAVKAVLRSFLLGFRLDL